MPTTIEPEPAATGIGPAAFQHNARDFLAAHRAHQPPVRYSPARLFLICRAIELAAKALHLESGAPPKFLKGLGHDLVGACDPTLLASFSVNLDAAEVTELAKANSYYEDKGFEYYYFGDPKNPAASGPEEALSGWPNLPDEAALVQIAEKLLSHRVG